ncbi:MAG: alcohol dehydrogenase catalytic domain-containing protein [Candidatus Omnitrophica bacterium]|nr:alcohol dehydrogenase catalytic domain-containing protein [Candidatus Omnitrophota bacterium]
MRACLLDVPSPVENRPLRWAELPTPEPRAGELLLRVRACGVCRTDLHVVEGELARRRSPLVPGHQIVGIVEALGPDVSGFRVGDRVGVGWLHSTCGRCKRCTSGRENIEVLVPPPADVFALPATSIAALRMFSAHGYSAHRVKLRGVVTGRKPGEAVFLREGGRGLVVFTDQPGELAPGEIVLTTPFAPPLPEGVRRETEDQLLRDREHYESSTVYSPGIASYESLTEKGVSAVLYSSFYWQAADQEFVRQAYPGSASYSAFLSDVAAQGDVALEVRATPDKLPFHAENIYAPTFDLWRWTRPGPNLMLYLLPEP